MSHDWTPHPPPPPKGPENRVECSSCGYCASKSRFNEVHGKHCAHGILTIAIVVSAIIFAVIVFVTGT